MAESSGFLRSLRALVRAGAVVLGALLAISLLPVGAQASSASDFVSRINAERASRGEAGLAVRSDLMAAAQAQAERMADKSKLYHNPNLGGSVSHWVLLGENVGYGPDVATIHRAFMKSAPHRHNILNTAYTEVGVGVVFRDHVMWVAEMFRKPTGTTSSGGSGSSGSKSGSSSHSSSHAKASSSTSHAAATKGTHKHAAKKHVKAHKKRAAAHRPVFRPDARAVALATTADLAAFHVDMRIEPPVWTPPPDQPLREDPLPTAAFVSLGLLGLVLAGAATRIRLG